MSGLRAGGGWDPRQTTNGPPERCSAGPPGQARDGSWAGRRHVERADKKNFGKNTINLQWEIRGNYNASPCVNFEKVVSAKTMENNGENNAKNNGNSRKSGRTVRLAVTPEGRRRRCATGCLAAGACLKDLTMNLGAKAKRARSGAPDARMSLCT
jgi:hypothetical protein